METVNWRELYIFLSEKYGAFVNRQLTFFILQ